MQRYKYRPGIAGGLLAISLVALFSACEPAAPPASGPLASLQPFFSGKEQQARELSNQDSSGKMPPLMVDYFKAAARSDWRSLNNTYEKMSRQRTPANGGTPDRQYQTAAWQPV